LGWNTFVGFDPNIKAMRERLRKAEKPKKVAIVAYMHKRLSIIDAVIKSGKLYDPSYPQR
jgi:transposase